MYKLIIVDDEPLELEGMESLVAWEDFNIEYVGSAQNGKAGLKLIHEKAPDIVITDIRMPLMDGLEMIRLLREEQNPAEIIVLSGYGEYEYTSRAMEYGIRHYLLKPFDETQIADVIETVEEEIRRKRSEEEYRHTLTRLLPKAREQVFRNILLKRSQERSDYEMFLREIQGENNRVMILALRKKDDVFSEHEHFMMENIICEGCGRERLLMSAQVGQDLVFLLQAMERSSIGLRQMMEDIGRIERGKVIAALSGEDYPDKVDYLYDQVQQLFRLGKLKNTETVLFQEMFDTEEDSRYSIFSYRDILNAQDYEQVLGSISLSFIKMNCAQYDAELKRDLSIWMVSLFFPEDELQNLTSLHTADLSDRERIHTVTDILCRARNLLLTDSKEDMQKKEVFDAVFDHLADPELSIRYLSTEVLFMNEDYFGRLFRKISGRPFNTYLMELRLSFVKELLRFNPDMMLSDIAELTGFAPDGQYLSRAFRRQEGMSPSDFRLKMKTESGGGTD